MASFMFRRPNWSLTISRASRTFTVSFTTESTVRSSARKSATSTPSHTRRPHPQRCSKCAFSSTSRPQQQQQQQQEQRASLEEQVSTERQSSATAASSESAPISDITKRFDDTPAATLGDGSSEQLDWSRSFHGLSHAAFSKEAAEVLLAPIDPEDVEVKPDGILYLPEIKYRRILNKAFGPGGWGIAPRGETIVTPKAVTREYALVALGRLVSIARGEQDYFTAEGIPSAAEGCKSNALVRCCKDLGVASELWDPRFIRSFVASHVKEVWVEHVVSKKKKKISVRKDDKVAYPWKESKIGTASGAF